MQLHASAEGGLSGDAFIEEFREGQHVCCRKVEQEEPMVTNDEIVMWDLGIIKEVTPFKYYVAFPKDHRCYTRYVDKELADQEICKVENTPMWHDELKTGDTVAYFHENMGWCQAKIV